MAGPHPFLFTHLFIIESLAGDPHRTPEHVQAIVETVTRCLPGPTGLHVQRIVVQEPNELVGLLIDIKQRAEKGDRPILHFEMHGNETGIELRSQAGDEIVKRVCPWVNLKNALTNINIATCNGLLVTLGVCKGAFLADIVMPFEPAPFWALVGSFETLWSGEIAHGYGEFYRRLLQTGDGDGALAALRATVPQKPELYNFISCLALYLHAFRKYHERASRKATRREMVDEIVARHRSEGRTVSREQRKRIDRKLRDGREEFENWQRVFFMLDPCPQNADWVKLDYDRDVRRPLGRWF